MGNTEMAKATARHLFGDLTKLVRVDCSEYALPHEYAKLIGAPPGYIGHNEGGFLTEAVKEKKGCVVLFDEIEKAHFKVHNLLLQIMDEGFLTDNKGSIVGFSNTIIFLTSNVGVEEVEAIRNRMGFDSGKREVLDKLSTWDAIVQSMKNMFNPEFINRLDEMIVFNNLTQKDCVDIAKNQLNEVASWLGNTDVTFTFTPKVEKHIATKGHNPHYGARELRRLIQKEIEHPLSDLIISDKFKSGDTIVADINRSKVTFTKKKPKPNPKKKATKKDETKGKTEEKMVPVRT